MDNQQRKPEDIDLAWLAGFIDGEGSLIVKRLAGKRLRDAGYIYFTPTIAIANTHEETLAEVRRILIANGLPHHISRREGGAHAKPSWDVRVFGLRRCKRWLDTIKPYLRTKRSQAEAMHELCISRLEREVYRGAPSKREMELVMQLRSGRPLGAHRLHACTV